MTTDELFGKLPHSLIHNDTEFSLMVVKEVRDYSAGYRAATAEGLDAIHIGGDDVFYGDTAGEALQELHDEMIRYRFLGGQKMSKFPSEEDAILHVYAQEKPHDEVMVVGNRAGLLALVNAISIATNNPAPFEHPAITEGFFVNDGEGFDVSVQVLDSQGLEKLERPYTNKEFCCIPEKPVEMHLNQKYFDWVDSKKKNVEFRMYDEKRQRLRVGQEIAFVSPKNKKIQAKIKNIFVGDNFGWVVDTAHSLFANIGMCRDKLTEELCNVYPQERREGSDVCAIFFEVVE